MNPAVNGPGCLEAVRRALARHQHRREGGVPTLSVLVGPPDVATVAWVDWVDSLGWRPSEITGWNGVGADAGGLHVPAGWPERTVLYVRGPAAREGGRAPRLAEVVERLSRFLLSAGPEPARAVLALAVERVTTVAYLRDEPYSRARTMFTEGMIELPEPAVTAATSNHTDAAGRDSLARSAAVLTRHEVRAETAESFREASHAWREAAAPAAGNEAADRARSAAERFLHNLLGELPETAGLFTLNVRLDFCFGPMRAEVDLLAADLKLAVELDGFHHFRDPENYRRDRRKDALLQKQGYLVLRFLAEDVLVRLEGILEEIRAAVAFRRATR